MTAVVTRRDGPSGRFYEVDGELYPSVTHVLTAINKPAIVRWAANQEREAVSEAAAALYEELAQSKQAYPRSWYHAALISRLGTVKAHQRTMERAGDIGTQAHKAIEWIMRDAIGANAGAEPLISAPARVAVLAFRDWAARVRLKPILIERTVYSKTHQYAGTLDLLARVNGVLTMVDFKTGKAIYGESHLQAAAYSAALEEMGYLEPTASLVLRLRKDEADPTPFEPCDVPARAELLPVFLATRALWEWTYANEQAFRSRKQRTRVARDIDAAVA